MPSPLTSSESLMALAASGGPCPPARLAGFGSGIPGHPARPEELAKVLTEVWPELARHLGPLLDQSGRVGRRLVRPPSELATPLSPAAQTAAYRQVAPALAEAAAAQALPLGR